MNLTPHLTEAEKDALILSQQKRITELEEMVLALQQTVAELQARLGMNSTNSSQPPSSDGLNKPAPKSLRPKGQRASGGQPGHAGNTLKRVATPDQIVDHHGPAHCTRCAAPLEQGTPFQSRQLIDLPPLRATVTEHRIWQTTCGCGHVHTGCFPSGVTASVQYGPVLRALAVHLNHTHLLPVARTAQLIEDICGVSVSQAFVLEAGKDAGTRLAPTVCAIGAALQQAAVAHADETGMRIDQQLHWLHTLCTPTLTWIGRHAKRGQQAFSALGLLLRFKGILVHDGWVPYRALACLHALCNAHHLRELTYVHEQMKQEWARDVIDLLLHAHLHCASASPVQKAHWRHVYELLLEQGESANPPQKKTGKRGRIKQTKAANLLGRLRRYADEVWRFAYDSRVPFSNNLAEQAIRMVKVKQKIAGCFRTISGADTFCVIRSYLATLHQQGLNRFAALVCTFQGVPVQPRLG